ncbi:MAG: hypothetical protein ABEJ27_04460 [Halodesulfurarchaeum sp.]
MLARRSGTGMTAFDAEDPTVREDLFAEAIRAHRERESQFVTVEVDQAADPGPGPPPFIQYSAGEGLCNLDCLAVERSDIEGVIDGYSGATIVDRHEVTPETGSESTDGPNDSDGPPRGTGSGQGSSRRRTAVNLQVRIRGDERRIAGFMEECFVSGFGLDPGFRAWVVRI